MRYGWLAPLVLCLALASQGCGGSSTDVVEPPSGNNPPPPDPPDPPAPPEPPAPQPPPSQPPPSPPPGPPIPNPTAIGNGARVLFVGNSLTQVNDLPGMVRTMADAAGLDWDVQMQVQGGASLEDHWNRGVAPARIQGEHWDAVVFQQGPSSLPESRTSLRQWIREFDPLVRGSGGRSALYMVWPDRSRFAWFDRVRDSYALAARDVSGWFLPAGETWRAAWSEEPSLALYGGDGFHPTVAGTYAAAVTIFAGLSGRSPDGAPGVAGLDDTIAERLQRAAQEALDEYADYGPANEP